MGATLRFYICPLKSSLNHHHNKGFRRPSWADFHLALCVRESHLAFGVGAEGSKPSCPDYGETAFLCNPLSFTDIIHVQIILGPIVHPLRSQILAESSDKCNGRAGDMFHIVKTYNKTYRSTRICWKRENQLHATSWNNNQLQFLKNNIFFVVLFDTTNEHIFSLQWRHYNCSTVVAVVQTLALKRLQMIHFSMKDGSNIKLLDKNCFYKYLSVTLQFRRYSLLIKDCLK